MFLVSGLNTTGLNNAIYFFMTMLFRSLNRQMCCKMSKRKSIICLVNTLSYGTFYGALSLEVCSENTLGIN